MPRIQVLISSQCFALAQTDPVAWNIKLHRKHFVTVSYAMQMSRCWLGIGPRRNLSQARNTSRKRTIHLDTNVSIGLSFKTGQYLIGSNLVLRPFFIRNMVSCPSRYCWKECSANSGRLSVVNSVAHLGTMKNTWQNSELAGKSSRVRNWGGWVAQMWWLSQIEAQ